jgi:uncharacterized membrane protein YhhN
MQKKDSFTLSLTIFFFHILNSTIHLFSCYTRNTKIRIITKILIMPLLFFLYKYLTDKLKKSKYLQLGIILGWIGDLFLICKDDSPLIIFGIISFFIGHIFYIFSFIKLNDKISYRKNYFILLIILTFFVWYVNFLFTNYLCEGFKKHKMTIPGISYMSILGLIDTFAIFNLYLKFSFGRLLCLFGTILFSYSDFCLAKHLFIEKLKYENFIIMSTYIPAQTLIILGMASNTLSD